MRKFQCLLFVFKRSYICCYIICMTVPLRKAVFRDIADIFYTLYYKEYEIIHWRLSTKHQEKQSFGYIFQNRCF